MQFEWDEEKNRINKEKHDGIGFEYAVRVFLDDKRIERYDAKHSTLTEDRWNAIGMVGKVLFVVYTERSEKIRIISARRATKAEEQEYYNGYEFR
jgi:hypothetical protein